MEENFKKYSLLIIVFCISFISIGTSLFLLNGGKLGLLKKRLGASVVNSVPQGSTITDVEFYAELVDSYNAEKGTGYDYTHVFTEQELASLQTLVIDENGSHYHGNPVQDISGLSSLTGLKNLVLHVAGIQNVDLRSNTELETLDIDIPALRVLNLFGNNSLQSVNTTKPTTAGYIIVKKGHAYSYLFGANSSQDETVGDNSFGIICEKYNLAVGESANCVVKGKTIEQMDALAFSLEKSNNNITISNIQKTTSLMGSEVAAYYGNVPLNTEFDIISFTITANAAGTAKVYLTDYDEEENKIGYTRVSDHEVESPTGEISKTIYINKFVMKDASGIVVSSGKLKTNYVLNIVNGNGEYDSAFYISVLGDIKADGIVNIQDVGMAYTYTADKTDALLNSLTEAERKALDWNFDGTYNLLDVNDIYNKNIKR